MVMTTRQTSASLDVDFSSGFSSTIKGRNKTRCRHPLADGNHLSCRPTALTDKREREDKNLSSVGRISQRLGVADHPGVENHLARTRHRSAEILAAQHAPIRQSQCPTPEVILVEHRP
jgi:hypothetical protein